MTWVTLAGYIAAMMQRDCDILVIGSGLAGLAFALKVADHARVLLVTKEKLDDTNSAMAQGGIAAVTATEDHFDSHIRDTLVAGAGLCREDVVRRVVEDAPARIRDLIRWGVKFDKDVHDNFDLHQEGGHTARRILHIADHTGLEIHKQLMMLVRAHPGIEILDNHVAVDLITRKQLEPSHVGGDACWGAVFLDRKTSSVHAVGARFTVLATGGAGKVYLYTSNWSGATGDGIAMAHRAGARIANLEFMQFHPTCLFHPQNRNFLISEALRGEGAELCNAEGEPFMSRYHERGSLAPRDIVARSIDAEMKRTGAECVFLDITHRPASFLREHFPSINSQCLRYGIDMTRQPIPVVPAAHYLCGGILTNMHGETDIARLFAIGETACTGLHGANRLASNSLLECLVFAETAAKKCLADMPEVAPPRIRLPTDYSEKRQDSDELIVVHHMWDEIRRLMWNYVGIVRTHRRLERAENRLLNIQSEIKEYYLNFRPQPDVLELRNIALVAHLTVQCALARRESRGIHYNLDHPFPADPLAPGATDTVL
jgi:L-aspartate oxidase